MEALPTDSGLATLALIGQMAPFPVCSPSVEESLTSNTFCGGVRRCSIEPFLSRRFMMSP